MPAADADAEAGAGIGATLHVLSSRHSTLSLRQTATEHCSRLLQRRKSSYLKLRQYTCTDAALQSDMISPDEYEALPPSIQRKYFSPKERMHIAQQAANQMRKRQSIKGSWLLPPTPTAPTGPSTSAGTLSIPSTASASRSSLIDASNDEISVDQARWFLMLPDKVRKQQFTTAEQVKLMRRCKTVLEDVSPEMVAGVYRRFLNSSRNSREWPATVSRSSTAGDVTVEKSSLTFETCLDDNAEDTDWEVDMLKRYSGAEKSLLELETNPVSQPSVAADDLFNTVSIPPPPPAPTERDIVQKSKRMTFRRRRQPLMPLPLPAPTLAPPRPSLPLQSLSSDNLRHFALSAQQSSPSTETPPTNPPTNRKSHYQDQTTRTKLRAALSSPQKFDETLTFGFPHRTSSTTSSSTTSQPRLSHSPTTSSDSDEKSLSTLSPSTPPPGLTKQASFDAAVDREMTIHMTLTRADLSPEERLYSSQRYQTTGVDVEKVDPLALQPLRVEDDGTGSRGAFAVEEAEGGGRGLGLGVGLGRRVWRGLVGR